MATDPEGSCGECGEPNQPSACGECAQRIVCDAVAADRDRIVISLRDRARFMDSVGDRMGGPQKARDELRRMADEIERGNHA